MCVGLTLYMCPMFFTLQTSMASLRDLNGCTTCKNNYKLIIHKHMHIALYFIHRCTQVLYTV